MQKYQWYTENKRTLYMPNIVILTIMKFRIPSQSFNEKSRDLPNRLIGYIK